MIDSSSENSIFKKAIDWESSRVHLIELSERRAWKIAMAAVITTLLSWIALVLLLPLKESVPYLIKVNKESGAHEILTHLDSKTVTQDEVMDKYWVSNYVRAREGYDWYTLKKDY